MQLDLIDVARPAGARPRTLKKLDRVAGLHLAAFEIASRGLDVYNPIGAKTLIVAAHGRADGEHVFVVTVAGPSRSGRYYFRLNWPEMDLTKAYGGFDAFALVALDKPAVLFARTSALRGSVVRLSPDHFGSELTKSSFEATFGNSLGPVPSATVPIVPRAVPVPYGEVSAANVITLPRATHWVQ